jgi:hypothetical protein
MYGMEQKREKASQTYALDLENQLKRPEGMRAMQELLTDRASKLRALQQKGVSPEEFDRLKRLFLGYQALQELVQRMQQQNLR